MEGDGLGTSVDISRCPHVGILNHEMRVERQIGHLAQSLDHRHTHGEIRHEMVVHDVDVDAVGGLDASHLPAHVGEIGIENARGDAHSHDPSLEDRCRFIDLWPRPRCDLPDSPSRPSGRSTQDCAEHGIGTMPVRPQLDEPAVRAGGTVGHAGHETRGVQGLHRFVPERLADDFGGFAMMR